ncbi:MAG: pilus assembly protein PilM [Patescibacteria group bacterium]
MANIFSKLFPPPNFLRMSSVGLDISDKSVRFLGFRQEKDGFRIDRFAEIKLDSGVVSSGKIKDENKIKEALSALAVEHNLKFIRASLPEEEAYLFSMNLPKVSKNELRESISLQLEEYAPIKVAEAVFDYEIINESSNGFELEVSAIPGTVVENYTKIFRESGLVPISFEIEAQAIARAAVMRGDPGTYMLIDIGQAQTGISIVSAGTALFTSTLEIGGILITEAIAQSFSISATEAEKIKKEKGLINNKGRKKGDKDVFTAVLGPLTLLRDEINKHYIYWHTHKETESGAVRKIEKLILCGGEANLKGLPDYLAKSMRVKVELADVWRNVPKSKDYVPEIVFGESLTYATAVGLALRDAQYD